MFQKLHSSVRQDFEVVVKQISVIYLNINMTADLITYMNN